MQINSKGLIFALFMLTVNTFIKHRATELTDSFTLRSVVVIQNFYSPTKRFIAINTAYVTIQLIYI